MPGEPLAAADVADALLLVLVVAVAEASRATRLLPAEEAKAASWVARGTMTLLVTVKVLMPETQLVRSTPQAKLLAALPLKAQRRRAAPAPVLAVGYGQLFLLPSYLSSSFSLSLPFVEGEEE